MTLRQTPVAAAVTLSLLVAVSCYRGTPAGPTSADALNTWLEDLRGQGVTIQFAERIPPETNGFFTVPAQQVLLNDARVSTFAYPTDEAAAADAAQVSADGQPAPLSRVTWVSTPHFYRQGPLIVVYVGCATEIVQALDATLGRAFVVGTTPCR